LTWKSEGKNPHSYILENDNVLDLKEMGCEPVDGINLAHMRAQARAFVNPVMNLQHPYTNREETHHLRDYYLLKMNPIQLS
jgi:hypothetical protein